jgi:hypothetical protein
MVRRMAQALALAVTVRLPRIDVLRGAIVCGCALALIAAGQPLPF